MLFSILGDNLHLEKELKAACLIMYKCNKHKNTSRLNDKWTELEVQSFAEFPVTSYNNNYYIFHNFVYQQIFFLEKNLLFLELYAKEGGKYLK